MRLTFHFFFKLSCRQSFRPVKLNWVMPIIFTYSMKHDIEYCIIDDRIVTYNLPVINYGNNLIVIIHLGFRSHTPKVNMMWWALWCAMVVAGVAGAAAAPAPDSLSPLDMVQMDSSAPDDETLGYAMSPMAARYSGGAPWLYLLADVPRDSQRLAELQEGRARPKRKMPSLSINNPMEVLRQRLLLEVARKQMREANQRQAVANRLFLQNVGKRGFWANSAPTRYDN
ncbi:diuretic hormone 45 isoform X3 [Trichoplusia ni]|uniref:Diuretic hormone 45 isoform X3 n=1 Tax=Trichoplusia ni TaxID=7111 RepID=A0A7E5VGG5_TRINI|nr:diuretic hormone 45 isoform X3 [Trichoplusia ni]